MSTLALHRDPSGLVRPEPCSPISIRKAVAGPGGADIAFIDGLQKKHSRMVGFMPFKQIEARIAKGGVLIAEEPEQGCPVGYIIFADRYLYREELGICYQLNIEPHKQRGLVGAALVQAAFEQCAYGTKLFCCWCAQDIEANHFWESLGFVPLAFRAGSRGQAQGGRRKDQRVHIFWQKRVRADDAETAWWYPTETKGGALKEGRIVLPIQPGTHWSDAKLVVLPGMEGNTAPHTPALPDSTRPEPAVTRKRKEAKARTAEPKLVQRNGLRFGVEAALPTDSGAPKAKQPKPKREKLPKQKNDPKMVAAAREFRDRYLEQVNAEGGERLLGFNGKYEVSRQLAHAPSVMASIEVDRPIALPEAA